MARPKEIDYEQGLRLVNRLTASGKLPLAVRWADHLCRHRPEDPRAHNQAGLVRQRIGEPAQATAHFRKTLLLRPDASEVWTNLGTACRHVADFAAASRSRRRAFLCRPDLAEVRFALALDLLAAGDYRSGFAEFEHRPHRASILARYAARGVPAWDGRDPAGLRLAVVTEQGAGDAVQFLRFVKPLADHGAEVTIACPAPLARLARLVPGAASSVTELPKSGDTRWDCVELLMSLPARLGVDRSSLPTPARYIEPPEPRHVVPRDGALRVGLCWTGSTLTPLNSERRIALAQLAPLLAIPGARFYGLQVLVGRREMEGEERLVDLAPHIDDFADTAAMIDQMDLVITVDTSVAHIAGALGRPVWTLLARVADWRWGYDTDTTPWYPSMRLFRQHRPGAWDAVVERVASELSLLAAGPIRPGAPPFASSKVNG